MLISKLSPSVFCYDLNIIFSLDLEICIQRPKFCLKFLSQSQTKKKHHKSTESLTCSVVDYRLQVSLVANDLLISNKT